MSKRQEIYGEIGTERHNQDLQWGGPEHDDEHDPFNWFGFIYHQVDKGERETPETAAKIRARLVKIAALAVAGIESIDRQAGERPA